MEQIIAKWGKYADMIYQEVLDLDWGLEDWSWKDEEGNYEYNDYFDDNEAFIRIVKCSLELKEKLKGRIYNADKLQMLELSNNHTLFDINSDIDMETYYMLVKDKMDEFESITDVEVFAEGRSGRHMCVYNNLENAYRYDELCNIQQKLEQELIDELNSGRYE